MSPNPPPAVPAPSPAIPAPAPKPTVEVIVDSTPTGAKILRNGAVAGETPEALALAGPETIVLHKDGYTDKSVSVNPAATHKLVVKLDRPRPIAKAAAPTSGNPEFAKAGTRPPSSKPGEPADPYAAPPKPATTPKPGTSPRPGTTPKAAATAPAKPHDDLSSRVEKAGESIGHRVGALYRGAAADEGGRSDWFAELEGGHCYTFVGEGGDGVQKLYLYLWGPAGRRLTSTRQDTAHPRMSYCTAFRGTYHFQAKVDDGKGEYRLGIYGK